MLLQSDARDAAAALAQRRRSRPRPARGSAARSRTAAGDRQLVAVVLDDLEEEARCSGRPCAAARSSAGSAGRSPCVTTQPVASRARAASAASRASFARSGRRTPGCRRSRRRCACASSSSSEPSRLERPTSPPREHLVRLVLRGLHVGLVERVDAEDRAGDGGRELPAEELLAELVRAREPDLAAPGGRARRGDSPGAGTSPLPCLPVDSASSCSAQRPKPPATRRCRPCRGPPASPRRAARPSSSPGLPSSRRHASAISCARSSSRVEVDAHQRRGHDPEQRERRVAAADRRLAREDARNSRSRASCSSSEPGSVIARSTARRAGAASRSIACASASRASCPTSTRRGRASARDRAAPRARGSPPGASCRERGTARAERPAQHLGRERRAAHAEQHDVVDARPRRPRRASATSTSSRMRVGSSSQPSQCASSAPVQTVGSRDQIRSTSSRRSVVN